MPPVCTVCKHPQRADVERELVNLTPLRSIADRFGLSKTALIRHRDQHLTETLVRAHEASETQDALDVQDQLRRCFDRVNRLLDALDAELRDPDDPDTYYVGPRADEVQVAYWGDGPAGRPVLRKATLATLLARLDAAGVEVDAVEVRRADPRDLLLKATGRLHSHIELLAELVHELDRRPVVNLVATPEWLSLRAALLDALSGWPDARLTVAERLAALEVGGDDARD